jgi:UDP-N-acetyl-D-glucosamine/UDP-N-acetyl-D-galactosamine dehydrogenase
MIGYHPQVILAGQRINDGMGAYVAQQTLKQLIKNGTPLPGAKVIVLGLTFKQNCPDLRNSKVADVKSAFDRSAIIGAGFRGVRAARRRSR